jgi:hypothetical protein
VFYCPKGEGMLLTFHNVFALVDSRNDWYCQVLASVLKQWSDHNSIGTNGSSFAKRRRPKGIVGSEDRAQLLCCQ